MRRSRSGASATLCVVLAVSATSRAALEPQALRGHVEYLSADELRGRDTGEPGIRKAETYVARAFRRAGLAPLPGQSSHFIDFNLYRTGYDLALTSLELDLGSPAGARGPADRVVRGRAGVDFRPFPFSDDGNAVAPVAFAGYGISAPEADWDDYEGLDVRGKLVLVLRHSPGEGQADSPFAGEANRHALFETKAAVAAEHGAVGMLLVTDPLNHAGGDDLRLQNGRLALDPRKSPAVSSDRDGQPFLAMQLSRELVEQWVRAGGHELAGLQRALDAGTPPRELTLGDASARLSIRTAAEAERVSARNVAGFLEGRDPVLKHEWIVIGGHHDHVGAFDGPGDTVFNGADDNASGTAGVLELARWFASRGERPRRSLVFVTFTAEERGLLGSRALVEQRVLPPEQVAFMLNLDMIGRNPDRPVDVFGDGYVRGLRELVEAANADVGLALSFGGAAYAADSDHDAFYSNDIPFMFFFTGLHEDYHQPGDHADKLDYAQMSRIVGLAAGVIERVAEAPRALSFVHHVGWLGARIEVLGDESARAATVTGIDDGSRGAAAGLRTGDVIAAFDGAPLERADTVGQRFRVLDPGTRVKLGLLRDGGTAEVEVERAKTGYLGVIPAIVDDDTRRRHGLADGEGLLLREVVEGGPAERAGLSVGDIVIRVGGQPVDPKTLRSHLMRIGAGETVDFTIVRNGERLAVPVTLGERP